MESRPKAYICDPEKNVNCKKTLCRHSCFLTRHEEYARLRDGKPIESEDGLLTRLEALKADHRPDGGYYRGVRDSINVVKEALGYGE